MKHLCKITVQPCNLDNTYGELARKRYWHIFHSEELSIRSSYLEVYARLKKSRGWRMQQSITITSISERPQKRREMHLRAIARRGSMVLPEGIVFLGSGRKVISDWSDFVEHSPVFVGDYLCS